MSASNGSGSAGDATVEREPTPDEQRVREYLYQVADEAEAAVENVMSMIEDLKASLKDRVAQAKAARKAAETGQE